MAPRTRPLPKPVEANLSRAVAAEVRAGLEACERGETLALTAEEAEHYYASGELPERAWLWAASPE
jgi:hypothetical protein